MKIERTRINGEPVRRFFLIAEVTFADREAAPRDEHDHNYYEDQELDGLAKDWMGQEMQYHDDSPAVRFHRVPEILEVDVQSIARGDYPAGKEGRSWS
jgi:hypothetical protein